MALRAARKRPTLLAPMVMGKFARSRIRVDGRALLLDLSLRRLRSSTPEARLSEQERARDGRRTDGSDGSTKSVDLDEEGSGALDVLCTLGLRLLASIIHRGSTYSSSSEELIRLEASVVPLVGLSTVFWENRKDESVACTSRRVELAKRLGCSSK